jgi:hypothetical protein
LRSLTKRQCAIGLIAIALFIVALLPQSSVSSEIVAIAALAGSLTAVFWTLTFWSAARVQIGRLGFRYKVVRRYARTATLSGLLLLIVWAVSLAVRSSSEQEPQAKISTAPGSTASSGNSSAAERTSTATSGKMPDTEPTEESPVSHDSNAMLDSLCTAAQGKFGVSLVALLTLAAASDYSRNTLAEALVPLPQRETIKQLCAQRGVEIAVPLPGTLRSIAAARELALHWGEADRLDESPPTELEEREALRAFCAARTENPGTELGGLIMRANVIFSEDPNVSADRTEPVMGKIFAKLSVAGSNPFDCH